MKINFDAVSVATSKLTTRTYSTSFSLGIYCLNKSIHSAIYNIYGFVRLADEIVDSFNEYNREILLSEFREDTYRSIQRGISLNPILNSFQNVANEYGIEMELIDCFLNSMEMDLTKQNHSHESYKQYILGSAEVVGLMCLRVFTGGNNDLYLKLKPAAMKLGSALQKVNFLRDMKEDCRTLGRVYFPNLNMEKFTEKEKIEIEKEIEIDFKQASEGIKKLPTTSRFGVYVAYVYYYALFSKIKSTSSSKIMEKRIRISNPKKISLLVQSYLNYNLRLL